ncbi:ANTAR domain-containing protein [Geodermatophilus sp. YIM 151500]|uniref:ANTAR domain-containing protein n=1 Tax=Geodermatophilus sp. YIM 151500 TaxID=2984531 RepID=UPI0021E3DC94|nr:ANTAR domain-containing protein [Geodermatophilus sp. YIM 151500]MCV2490997.1 ANTAR domain-containing protein [Geodermatophilus sp. YIM 151500]
MSSAATTSTATTSAATTSTTPARQRGHVLPLRPVAPRSATDDRMPSAGAPGAAGDAERVRALETEVAQLRTAMASRAVIEQAKGVLMLLTGCGEQAAFDLMAHISSHTHRKVRDVAHVLTASASGRTGLPDDVRAILRDACPPSVPLH